MTGGAAFFGRGIGGVYRCSTGISARLPLFVARIPAGFPSPADDYIDCALDLNELLVRHPAATFFVRVSGDSMTGAGIFSGDILVVDRAEQAAHNSIVIAELDGELTVKRLVREGSALYLFPENPAYRPIQVTGDTAFSVWGVVVHVIRSLRGERS
ncbi:MAG TPA: translesion error-prone DNA polymerase V autoproteolytic subunit [Spirochaetota bacterium]|nr:translesion error-prone DNA polymerase V autoproteolytic subunit [Spirochaetota bacterium]